MSSPSEVNKVNLSTFDTLLDRIKRSSSFNLIISVSRDCVLQCDYCYAIDPENIPTSRILPLDLVEKIINEAFDLPNPHISFEWTGGEAMLAGEKFYRKVVEWQKKYHRNGKTYSNSLQTSGGIYNEKLYDFLIENEFGIGITIDGPPDLHNANRPMKKGTKSFDTVLRSYNYIKKKQGQCGVLSTVTTRSLGREGEIMDFYRDELHTTNWHSNPYVYDWAKPKQERTLGLSPEQYADYYIAEFEAYLKRDDTVSEPSHIKYLMKSISGIKSRRKCTHSGTCLTNFLNIDDEGNATFCPKFLGYEQFRLGHVRTMALNQMVSVDNPLMKQLLHHRVKSMNGCESEGCKYLSVCNSGCPYDSFLNSKEGTIESRDYLCSGKHKLYSHVESKLNSFDMITVNSKV